MSDEIELSPEEREALRAMKADQPPPPGMEDAIVAALTRQGLIGNRRGLPRVAVLAVAAAAILAAVVWLRMPNRQAPAPTEPRFVLLLYAGDDAAGSSGPSRRQEYEAWARRIAEQGTRISGEELADGSDEVTLAGPAPEARLAEPRGYFVISAPDAAAARQIASTCPHLQHGGRVVVRKIVS
jgi:hypothetical protein